MHVRCLPVANRQPCLRRDYAERLIGNGSANNFRRTAFLFRVGEHRAGTRSTLFLLFPESERFIVDDDRTIASDSADRVPLLSVLL